MWRAGRRRRPRLGSLHLIGALPSLGSPAIATALDGLGVEEEPRGDGLVRATLGHQSENLLLPPAQPLQKIYGHFSPREVLDALDGLHREMRQRMLRLVTAGIEPYRTLLQRGDPHAGEEQRLWLERNRTWLGS